MIVCDKGDKQDEFKEVFPVGMLYQYIHITPSVNNSQDECTMIQIKTGLSNLKLFDMIGPEESGFASLIF